MKKELKIKQKTLGTYEYLMRLPPEQEQNVIKCKHCPKFFLSRPYLQKHYQRHHPSIDFNKDFNEGESPQQEVEEIKGRQEQLQKTVNQRLLEMTQKMDQEKQVKQKQQEELSSKIRNELFSDLADNLRRVEQEL